MGERHVRPAAQRLQDRPRGRDVRWLESRAFPVKDTAGKVIRYVGVATDITHRHRREQLQDFLAQAGLVLASSLDHRTTLEQIARLAVPRLADWCIVYVLDEDGAHVEVASQGADQEAPSQQVRRYLSGSDIPPSLRKVMDEGHPALLSVGARGGWGGSRTGDGFMSALEALAASRAMVIPVTARGQALGALALVSAETGPRYVEDDLALATELARRAGLAIDNARLFTAAQEAIKARDEVVGTVAHDLGNPLSVISIVCRSLLNRGAEAFDAATLSLLEGTYESSVRMGRLIDDLLDVTRLDAVGLPVHPEPTEVTAFLRDLADKVRPLAENKRIALEVEIPAELPEVRADGDRLSQVMWNLLGNAIKFTPEEGSVRVAAQADGDHVRISVIDTGPGIPAEVRPTLFDRFARGGQKRRGSGLGLAISKGIVEAHGGRIWIGDEDGRGCAMHFTLPVG